jgi:hypothetical protein
MCNNTSDGSFTHPSKGIADDELGISELGPAFANLTAVHLDLGRSLDADADLVTLDLADDNADGVADDDFFARFS